MDGWMNKYQAWQHHFWKDPGTPGHPALSPKGASPASPAFGLPLSAHLLALSMSASSQFPCYHNVALFLSAGNPSWSDNTPLESDLKNFLLFFLILGVRQASAFLLSPGRGEIEAGSATLAKTCRQQTAARALWWDPLKGGSVQVESPAGTMP